MPTINKTVVMNSGAFVLLFFSGAITTLSSTFAIKVNGTTVSSKPPVWDSSLPFISVALNTSVLPTDSVQAIVTDTGAATGLAGTYTATNLTGKNLEDVPSSGVHMPVGWNAPITNYYNVLPFYNDLGKHLSGDSNKLTAGSNHIFFMSNQSNPVSPKNGHPSFPMGDVNVSYDDASPQISMSHLPFQTHNTFTRAVTANSGDYFTDNISFTSPTPVKNLSVYPPGANPSQKFSQQFLDKIGNTSAIRFMDTWLTNTPGLISMADVNTTADASYAVNKTQNIVGNVVGIGPYANTAGFFWSNSGWSTLLVTTQNNHNMVTGQQATLNIPANVVFEDNSEMNLTWYSSIAYVTGPKTFAMIVWSGTSSKFKTQSVTGSFEVPYAPTMPLEDMVELCNTTNSDMWFNIPILFTNAAALQAFTYISNHLKAGLKCYLEYANEPWNYASGFNTFWYVNGMGALEGLSGTQWYTKRTGQYHQLASLVLTDDRMVRVFGSFYISSWYTSEIVNYAHANGYQVDAIAIAPYLNNQPQSAAMAPIIDTLTNEQMLDLFEANVFSGVQTNLASQHKTVAQAVFPNCKLVCYEGGPQDGTLSSLSTDPNDRIRRSQMWIRHPRMGQCFRSFLYQLQKAGVDLYVDYTCIYNNDQHVWGRYSGYNQVKGLGDGTDGKFDNRTGFYNLDQIVSVVGYEMDRWSSLVH